MTKDVEHLSMCHGVILHLFSAKCVFKSLAHFFLLGLFVDLLLRFESYVCILDTNCLLAMLFVSYFLPLSGLSFQFLNSIFHRAKVWIFMESRLSLCSLMDCTYGVISKKSLSSSRSQKFCSFFFSPRSVIILSSAFRSVIHFEGKFVCDTSYWSNFFFSPYDYPIVPAPLIEKTILSLLLCLCMCGSFLNSILIHWSASLPSCQYHTLLITEAL